MELQNQGDGYHQSLFVEKPNFICLLCFMVAKNPVQCKQCGCFYCSSQTNMSSNTFECLTCGQVGTLVDLPQKLMESYVLLQMICTKCHKCLILIEYETHQCQTIKFCKTNDIMNNIYNKQDVCSPACLLMKIKNSAKSEKQMLHQIRSVVNDSRNVWIRQGKK